MISNKKKDIEELTNKFDNCYISTKLKILKIFNKNVKNKQIDLTDFSNGHDGKVGTWLEKEMGIKPNSNNAPDIDGFEMKKSAKKITFGDWSATEYIYSKKTDYIKQFNSIKKRDDFIKTFGTPNLKKNNRYSWSGSCCPTKYRKWTNTGQKLTIRENDIGIYYSYVHDKRPNKKEIIPQDIRECLEGNENEGIWLAYWTEQKLKQHVENKFNQRGFFMCNHNRSKNCFTNISFGKRFDYNFFLEQVKQGIIFFDSGMYIGNSRNYSSWRANDKFWDSLLTDT